MSPRSTRRKGPAADYDCAIIGGGPGGLVSALYLRRFKRDVVLINAGKPRAAWIPRTHNLLGYHRGISGRQLLSRMQRQVVGLGLDAMGGEARVDRKGSIFEVTIAVPGGPGREPECQVLRARKVILATGFEDIHPEIANVAELRRAGLLRYCSICDAYEYRDHVVSVIARDDAGVQKALFVAHWTKRIRLIIPEGLKLAPQRVRALAAVDAQVLRCETLSIEPSRDPKGVWICLDGSRPFYSRVAYIELGCTVRDSAFAHLRGLRRSAAGFLTTTLEQRTSVPGLFAVGDCVDLLGQIAVAAGQAAVAATTIHNDLL